MVSKPSINTVLRVLPLTIAALVLMVLAYELVVQVEILFQNCASAYNAINSPV